MISSCAFVSYDVNTTMVRGGCFCSVREMLCLRLRRRQCVVLCSEPWDLCQPAAHPCVQSGWEVGVLGCRTNASTVLPMGQELAIQDQESSGTLLEEFMQIVANDPQFQEAKAHGTSSRAFVIGGHHAVRV